MITRLRLTSGEIVDTIRYTYLEVLAAKAAKAEILVGGPNDCVQLPGMPKREERVIYSDEIDEIREVTS